MVGPASGDYKQTRRFTGRSSRELELSFLLSRHLGVEFLGHRVVRRNGAPCLRGGPVARGAREIRPRQQTASRLQQTGWVCRGAPRWFNLHLTDNGERLFMFLFAIRRPSSRCVQTSVPFLNWVICFFIPLSSESCSYTLNASPLCDKRLANVFCRFVASSYLLNLQSYPLFCFVLFVFSSQFVFYYAQKLIRLSTDSFFQRTNFCLHWSLLHLSYFIDFRSYL